MSNSPAPLHVVIADDDELVRLMVEQAVRIYAPTAQITTAPDGRAALQACVEQPTQLLITDDQMPHLTGTELTRTLRLGGYTLVIMLASGYYLDETAAYAAGADFVYSKPWNITHLRHILALAQERGESSR